MAFLDKTMGEPLCEKCEFWDFKGMKFLSPKKVSFRFRTLLIIIYFLLGLCKMDFVNREKHCIFFYQSKGKPLLKMLILGLEKMDFFYRKRATFFSSKCY